jgi:hypothetical protein
MAIPCMPNSPLQSTHLARSAAMAARLASESGSMASSTQETPAMPPSAGAPAPTDSGLQHVSHLA